MSFQLPFWLIMLGRYWDGPCSGYSCTWRYRDPSSETNSIQWIINKDSLIGGAMNFHIGPSCDVLHGLKKHRTDYINGLVEKTLLAGKAVRVTVRAWIL